MENNRFIRTELLIGKSAMQNLRNSTVMIIGLGAVGGFALEALARAGVGHMILVDFDSFEESNINRQILALSSTIGQKKTEVAAKRVAEINPDCQIEIMDSFINADNLSNLFSRKVDFVIDAIDALNPKCCLIEYMVQNNIRFISSMGAALKTDPVYIKTGLLSQSKNCNLAKFIRKRLRKRNIDITKIDCVYSDEQVLSQKTALQYPEEDDNSQGRTRCIMGSLPTITAIFGLVIAHFAIKKLSKIN